MKKFIILIPVYNDWDSLKKLLEEIHSHLLKFNNTIFKFVIINDASSTPSPTLKVPPKISSIEIINMKKNQGHARCIAFGIKHLSQQNNFDHLILMDGDGEDRPEEIKLLIEKALKNESSSIVAKRIKRSEGYFFQALYQIHKFITFISTGKNINFGNYSCLTKKDVDILSSKTSIWNSFSGSVKKHLSNLQAIDSTRGSRYFGDSKMSFFKLVIHSFAIISVFKNTVFLRSTLLIVLLAFLSEKLNLIVIFSQFLLVVFNLIIYLVSLREKKEEFLSSQQNKDSAVTFTH